MRMQRAVDAGFGGVALFAFGYEDARRRGTRSTPSPPSWRRPPPSTPTDRRERPGLSRDEGPPRRRHLRAVPPELRARRPSEPDAGPYAATIGVLGSTLQLLADGATHVGVASDHVIESFRNDLWPGYKTSAGMPPELLAQIPMVEEALVAMGVTTWAMVEHEADDALGAAAAVADADERVEQVLIVTPDKDLGQCVRGTRVVQFDRRKREIIDEAGVDRQVRRAAGVDPRLPRARRRLRRRLPRASPAGAPRARRRCSPATATSRTSRDVGRPVGRARPARRGQAGSTPCAHDFELALLFRRIATVETDVDVGTVDDWRWAGPTPEFAEIAERLDDARTSSVAPTPSPPSAGLHRGRFSPLGRAPGG